MSHQPATPLLSPRLEQVAELFAAGRTRRQAGAELGLKPASVKKYLQRARRRAAERRPDLRPSSTPTSPTRVRPFALLPTDHA
jgi:DNA-binding CsgD family transcriptional regulator